MTDKSIPSAKIENMSKVFFQSPEPGLHHASYTKMPGVLSDQIEEGLNLPKPFGTESTQLQ